MRKGKDVSKAILTDLGNVLVFFDPLRVAQYLSRHPLRLPLEQVNETLSGPEGAALFTAFETGHISGEGYVMGLEELFGAPLTRCEFWPAYLNIITVNERVVTLLRSLASSGIDLRLVAVTDVDIMRLDDALKRCKLPFRGVAASCRVGVRKPHPWMFETALAIADVPANDCFFVDDIEANVRAAEGLGLSGHRYTEPEELSLALDAFLASP